MQMGVVEAIKASLSSLPQQSIALRYLLSGSGDITLSDVDLAAASGGLVLGFNLEPSDVVETHAKRAGVRVMTYKVRRRCAPAACFPMRAPRLRPTSPASAPPHALAARWCKTRPACDARPARAGDLRLDR